MTPEQLLQLAYHHHQSGRLGPAEIIYRQLVAQFPNNAGALHMLGVLGGQTGHVDEGIELIQRAIVCTPGEALFHSNLAKLLLDKGRTDEAIAAAREAVRLGPESGVHRFNLANAYGAKGMQREAAAECREAIGLQSDLAGAHQNLVYLLETQGEKEAALAAAREAARLMPGKALGHILLGNALQGENRFGEAEGAYREALRIEPGNAQAQINLGYGFKEEGRMVEAAGCYREFVKGHPEAAAVHSNLEYALHFLPESSPGSLLAEHRLWNAQHAAALKASWPLAHGNERSAGRRLKIGYVSPDFREHPVGRMMMPLMRMHDREGFEIFCFSGVRKRDALTEKLRGHADQWVSTVGMTDQQVAELVRKNQIDILVDLTMHMNGNRLLAFARKPAPVQISYLAYVSTTGVEAIDYRLSDPYLDPVNGDVSCYTEKTVRLPETYWCYQEPTTAPEVGPLPADGAGHVTFGCLNNFCKVSDWALEAWAELMRVGGVGGGAGSRLILHAHEGSHRERVLRFLKQRGVSTERVEFVGMLPAAEYFAQYRRIDIALDPFPYAGGTTTCDAIYMGVPVVTLRGETAVGRGGVSILSNVQMGDFIGRTTAEYVRIAAALAGNRDRLRALRGTLRGTLKGSVLMDAGRFARNVEEIYRRLWGEFCSRPILV